MATFPAENIFVKPPSIIIHSKGAIQRGWGVTLGWFRPWQTSNCAATAIDVAKDASSTGTDIPTPEPQSTTTTEDGSHAVGAMEAEPSQTPNCSTGTESGTDDGTEAAMQTSAQEDIEAEPSQTPECGIVAGDSPKAAFKTSGQREFKDKSSQTPRHSTATDDRVDVAVQTPRFDIEDCTVGQAETHITKETDPVIQEDSGQEKCRLLEQEKDGLGKENDELGKQIKHLEEVLIEYQDRSSAERHAWGERIAALRMDHAYAVNEWVGKKNLLVMIRIKPGEEQDPERLKISSKPTRTISIPALHGAPKSLARSTFDMDNIFDQSCSNKHIFERIGPLFTAALDGKTTAVIADGQSNTGKSYTMFQGEWAIAKLASYQLTDAIEVFKHQGWDCQLTCSFLENYCDRVKDLSRKYSSRDTPRIGIEIRGEECHLTNVEPQPVVSTKDLESLIDKAMSRRTESSTSKNPGSSRGHLICILKFTRTHFNGETITSQLCFVDLAGSERHEQDASMKQSDETIFINSSRPAVRKALTEHAKSKRYRSVKTELTTQARQFFARG
ncbi:MAG: hypothetical protein Q9180_001680 [Flavoplaca navasiana]